MKGKRALLVSFCVIMLCMTVVIGMTYAIFTDSVSVKNHLKAGNLSVALTRTSLTYCVLDEDGYLVTQTVEDDVSFTESNGENVFGISSADAIIAPGSYFDATMKIENKGSVAFTYQIEFEMIGDANALAEQLEVTVTHADGTKTTKMLNELTDGLTVDAGKMTGKDTAQSFSVMIKFTEGSSNNAAKAQTAAFDLIVTAVQDTKST